LAKAYYEGHYWPSKIDHVVDKEAVQFVESSLHLVTLGPRHADYDVLSNTDFSKAKAMALADAADGCWEAIQKRDIKAFGASIRAGLEAQVAMFPNMMNASVKSLIQKYQDIALGWKLSGAGGGGYLILVSDQPIETASRVIARIDGE
jgi:galactokinase/mevalonate kinase-like predicted kinase